MSGDRLLDQVQPHLLSAAPYAAVQPPEVLAAKLGLPVDRIDKLDANENPFGPSPKALEALANYRSYHIYPDPVQRRLRESLANYLGYGPEWILPGAGSDEIIELALRLFVPDAGAILNFPPTFGMYSFLASTFSQNVIEVTRREDFSIDLDAAISATAGANLIFVASPNNPTGNSISRDELEALLETGLPVVVDEAYGEFDGEGYVGLVREKPNLVVTRTLSKWAGLAGLRVGYLVCDPAVVEIAMRIKQPYSVNLAAEIASVASFDDLPLLQDRVATIRAERERMAVALEQVPGLIVFPSRANFVLCQIEGIAAKLVQTELMERGIMVRYFDTPLLQNHLRLSAGRPEQTDRLVEALTEIIPRLRG